MHVALAALRKYNFHAIWWLVSPQNPLKRKTVPFQTRLNNTRAYVRHPKMIVTDIESKLHTQYSLQTAKQLHRHFPRTRFTWIAGMDNATIFHHWDGWRRLLKIMPFAFFNRPPQGMSLMRTPLQMYRGEKSIHFHLTGKTRNISSTQLRKKRFAHFFKSAV